MDALKYLKEKQRMCDKIKRDCYKCPLGQTNNGRKANCEGLQLGYPEESVEIVEKWSAEHPQKTILQDFLEKYPNALLNEAGVPESCCKNLGFLPMGYCSITSCEDCWNRPLEG